MSLSKFVLDSTDSITKKKSQRNKKLREQYAALSAQEKEIRLAKQREAYQRRKLNKFFALPAHEQLKRAEKSVIGETFRVHRNQAKVEDEQDRLAKKREMRRQKQREAYHKKKLHLSFGTHTSKDTEEIVDTAPATASTATMSTNCLSSEDLENPQKMESATSTANNILSAKVPSPENLQTMESVLPAANNILFAEVPSNSGLVIEKPVDTNAKVFSETNLSQSNNNDKCKKHVTVFSSYDKGCSSNTKSSDKYICSGNSVTHCSDERQLCSGCYNFLSQSLQELSEQSAPLSAIPPTTAPDNAKTSKIATQDNGQQTKSQARNSSRHCSVKRSRKKVAPAKGNTVIQGIDALNCIPHKSNKLPRKEDCQYCHAKKFHSETTNFCCSDGSVVLHDNKLPSVLVELFTAQTEEAICFRTYVRTYNNMFAFTSFGVHYDKALCKRNNGIYTFKIQGQTYHFINQLIPHHGSGMYLQLYFHDTDHELQNRMATSDRLTESLVIKIMEVMKTNPYACFFRSLRNVPQLDSYQIVLKSHTDNDQRVFNQPTASQIAALWVEGENSANIYSRHIQIYTKEGYIHRIQYYYGCYDPLQYPLLFPLGETGWHPGIKRSEKVNPKKIKRATKNTTDFSNIV
ncbi:uncharacterized protein [Coffea arabica]|uniref:Uncharacterized protein isoform X1 n=1 Tax=Coffea arabica TaxID=13443 RepID=A0ABM4X2P6_COFAR